MSKAVAQGPDFPAVLKGKPAQIDAFKAIRDADEAVRPSEISEVTGRSVDSTNRAVRKLRERGLIERVEHGLYQSSDVGGSPTANDLEDGVTEQLDLGASSSPTDSLASLFSQDTEMTVHTEAKVAAGTGRVVYPDHATHEVTFPKHFLSRLLGFHPPSTIGVMEAEGDSMRPTIKDGDLVIYEPVEQIRSAGIYVLHLRNGVTVKRVQPLPDGSYRIIPDNSHRGYSQMTLVPNDGDGFRLEETGRTASMHVVGKVRFPDRSTDEIHVQQVGEIIRSVVRGGEVDAGRWVN